MTLCRVCTLEHWREPRMQSVLREFASTEPGREHRKDWEIAHALLALADLPDGARVLGVGAGNEATMFVLTRAAEVHATDLYADAGAWGNFAPPGMLVNPGHYAPPGLRWEPRRLIVQHMDMRDLRYPDNTFDGVFSSGSIEHVGGEANIQRAAAEMGRVLRPGGVLSLSTEYKLSGEGHGWEGCRLFNAETLRTLVIEPSGCTLAGPLETDISEASRATVSSLKDAVARARRGDPLPRPHVVLQSSQATFTSVHLALIKPGGEA